MTTITRRRPHPAGRQAEPPRSLAPTSAPRTVAHARAWWARRRSAILIALAAAVVAGGLVRLATDRTVVRVVSFDEP